MMMNLRSEYLQARIFALACVLVICVFLPHLAEAAVLRVTPETGVYTVGNTFSVTVSMNTQGKPVNAADAQLSFNPRELSVVSVGKVGSVFTLWTLEPTFSNSAGTISFGGGSPSGYTGSNGTIMNITFRTLTAGTPKVTFKSASVLAADGMGTNVLSAMNGATFTVDAKSTTPPPEYIPPVNTPQAPKITSVTHPDETQWYTETTATLSWPVPSGVTAVRTLLDNSPNTVPTIVFDEPLSERVIDDLEQGTSYFHIQFKNADGWGRVAHYRLNVDTEPPKDFSVTEDSADESSPHRTLVFSYTDTSPVRRYLIRVDGGEPQEFNDTEEKKVYELRDVAPGYHTVVVEAFDAAGNVSVASYSFTVAVFDAPRFTEFPERVNSGVIPAVRGETRPRATVQITLRSGDREVGTYEVRSDEQGVFTFISDSPLPVGVYDISAIARDEYGAKSAPSESVRMIVEESGFIAFGSLMVRVLSVIVPLVALVVLLVFGTWFLWFRLRRWKRKVMRETLEAEEKLRVEFDALTSKLHAYVSELKESRKGKLTKAEQALIEAMEGDLRDAQSRIRKEIVDIEDVV